ncbi:MAG TPA: 3-isopropylmalate dehydratase large subunit [Candidatus Acetothermia bacterium]|nr:3-isopropylmalate dehydratase large subunit [Candidatus Acetothermia bacterium]
MGKTFAEKILAQKAGLAAVEPGQIVTARPDLGMSHDNTAAIVQLFHRISLKRVQEPGKFVVILDHVVPAASVEYAQNHKDIREFVREQGIRFYDVGRGVCHQVVVEEGLARPGDLILGADSHTPTYGALGAFSAGIGRSEMAALWATGELWLKVPTSFRIELEGELPELVTAKDVILYLIGKLGADGAVYRSVEFAGPIVERMGIADRMVMANMAAEMGAKNAFIAPDETTFAYLADRTKDAFTPIYPDPDAVYEKVVRFDVGDLEPQVACPPGVDHVVPISHVAGKKVDQVVLGTCTNGRIEDLRLAAEVMSGRPVAEGVRMIVLPASQEVWLQAAEEGLLAEFVAAGALVLNPGCGPCLGAHEGVLAPGEVGLATSNRNFKGRMGSPDAELYLGSPAVAAAAAATGKITDPRRLLEEGR